MSNGKTSVNIGEKITTATSIVFLVAFLLLVIVSSVNFTLGIVEANQDRAFIAGIVSVQLTQHEREDCPQLNEFQPVTAVLRVKLDHTVMIWSENGTGNGHYYPTNTVDLRIMALYNDHLQYLKSQAGKSPVIFHYSASFLSVCDSQRIPVISRFEAHNLIPIPNK